MEKTSLWSTNTLPDRSYTTEFSKPGLPPRIGVDIKRHSSHAIASDNSSRTKGSRFDERIEAVQATLHQIAKKPGCIPKTPAQIAPTREHATITCFIKAAYAGRSRT